MNAQKVLREKSDEHAAVRILEGRWGPYVTDGEVNASIPKGTTVEEVTLDHALELLEERAKKAPVKRKKAAAKKTTKKTTKKKAAKKTSKKASKKPSKKTAKKKS